MKRKDRWARAAIRLDRKAPRIEGTLSSIESPAAPMSGDVFHPQRDPFPLFQYLAGQVDRNGEPIERPDCREAHLYMARNAALAAYRIERRIYRTEFLHRDWDKGRNYRLCGTPRRWHRVNPKE